MKLCSLTLLVLLLNVVVGLAQENPGDVGVLPVPRTFVDPLIPTQLESHIPFSNFHLPVPARPTYCDLSGNHRQYLVYYTQGGVDLMTSDFVRDGKRNLARIACPSVWRL